MLAFEATSIFPVEVISPFTVPLTIRLAYVKGLKKVKNTHFLEVAYVNFNVSISRKNLKNVKTFLVS